MSMSRVEMAEYLMLPDVEKLSPKLEKALNTALELAERYDLTESYGLALSADFVSSPQYLEEINAGEALIKVFEKDDVVLYRKPHKANEPLNVYKVKVESVYYKDVYALNETEAVDIAKLTVPNPKGHTVNCEISG